MRTLEDYRRFLDSIEGETVGIEADAPGRDRAVELADLVWDSWKRLIRTAWSWAVEAEVAAIARRHRDLYARICEAWGLVGRGAPEKYASAPWRPR